LRALLYATSIPWAMTSEALETLLEIASREKLSQEETLSKLEALAAKVGKPLQNTRESYIRDGVAVVPVVGPIFRYANLFTALSGATSSEELALDITTALENPSVRALVLDINSPGGEVTGTSDLAKLIAAADKPVYGYVGGAAQSGGYWIASAADQIIVSDTSLLGSIGVVMSGSTPAPDREGGPKRFEIVSSQSPFKRVDPTSDSGRAKVQETVDSLAQVFIEAVASNRGVTAAKVISSFGAGHSFVGADAVAAGMADSVGTLESVIASLSAGSTTYSFGGTAAKERQHMNEKNNPTAAAEPTPAAPNVTQIRADGRLEGLTEGRKTERTRISAILSHAEAKDRDGLARTLAFDSDMDAEAAAKILAAAPKAVAAHANPLAEAMQNVPNPNVGAGAGQAGEETPAQLGARIAALANPSKK
jgi:signal peptide peptidase SppA